MGFIDDEIDQTGFKLHLIDLVDKYTGVPLSRVNMRMVMEDLFRMSHCWTSGSVAGDRDFKVREAVRESF